MLTLPALDMGHLARVPLIQGNLPNKNLTTFPSVSQKDLFRHLIQKLKTKNKENMTEDSLSTVQLQWRRTEFRYDGEKMSPNHTVPFAYEIPPLAY